MRKSISTTFDTNSQIIAGNTNAVNPTVDVNTNRFTSTDFEYDENGNMIRDLDPIDSQIRNFIFNGENKQTEVKQNGVTIGRYFYDGEGKRVKKVTDTESTIFVYSSGKLIAEYSTQISQTPQTKYLTEDHLGTPRIVTNELGSIVSRRDFMPFGEELYNGIGARSTGLQYGTNADDVKQKFTGYLKDNETKLDFAGARMYASRLGRFTAVDPLLASGKSANPQTFNRFIYVGNNPLSRTDPTGLDWFRRYNNGRWEFNEIGGDGWDPVDFGNSNYITVNNWCWGQDCGPVGYLYKSGGWDWGAQARYSTTNFFADMAIASGKWGWNGMATVSEVAWGAASLASWEFVFTGNPRKVPSVTYFEYSNQVQASTANALTAASFLSPAFVKSARTPIFAGHATKSTNGVGVGLGESISSEISRRPSHFRSGVDFKVWNSATDGLNGGKLCSTCGTEMFWKRGEPRRDTWHIDHYPKWQERNLDGLTRRDVLNNFNDLEKLRVRCAPCNLADNQ